MLLHTSIYVHGDVNPKALFDRAVQQSAILDRRNAALLDIRHEIDPKGDGRNFLYVNAEEELSAGVGVLYRPDGMALTEEEATKLGSRCSNQKCELHLNRPCDVMVMFAAHLDYSDDRPWNAGNLLESMCCAVGDHLDDMGVDWTWWENMTGTHHDDYEHLAALPDAVRKHAENPFQGMSALGMILGQLFGR